MKSNKYTIWVLLSCVIITIYLCIILSLPGSFIDPTLPPLFEGFPPMMPFGVP